MQELYDRRVLHNIVGVKPLQHNDHSGNEGDSEKERTANGEANKNSSSKSKAARDVERIWDDPDRHSDVEDYSPVSRDSRSHRRSGRDDDEGRYAIGRQPPQKRRKTGRSQDAHTVYFVDDEEEDELRYDDDDGVVAEVMEYMSDEESDRAAPSSRAEDPKKGARRSYWLSKATGIGGGAVEDDSN